MSIFKDGDVNTGFFHACVESRSRRNVILALKVGDVWLEGVYEIRQVVVDHFTIHFREPFVERLRLDGVSFRSISVEDNVILTAHFLLSKIDRAVALYDGNKSSDPNGFNISFFKISYPLLKDGLGEMFVQFHRFATLSHSFTTFFCHFDP